ncbi:Helix-turn-helix domain-containing protein [Tenacibaculum sp. MAR_2009_124]|uniref:helix-turn-helix domain-containing protein n=1 Tax=Tenacibaculum sp. MAR_2009_124 TaxID=1250059 RepID=UPI000895590A|nr:helix-turn-helix transcriptional regulator [Tenacibaculum sp. MAR_2009_124]SEC65934.1 Helix-turn-helix domain-containing protein [Tenacibaculum sp. MAR_2009_124]
MKNDKVGIKPEINNKHNPEKSGKYIKRLRKELGLNQVQFAQKLGLSQGNISDLERGKYDIVLSRFIEICKKLDFDDFDKILKK